MKNLWLIFSIVLNAALLLFVLKLHDRKSQLAPAVPSPVSSAVSPAKSNEALNTLQSAASAFADERSIGTLKSALIQAGYSEQAARAMITAGMRQYFSTKRSLIRNELNQPYWQEIVMTGESLARMRKVDRQEEMLFIKLGEDVLPEGELIKQRHKYGPLDMAARLAASEIDRKYIETMEDLNNPLLTVDERTEQRKLAEKKRLADLGAALGDEMLLEYNLRNSDTAASIRKTVISGDIDERTYRTIYSIQSARDQAASADVGSENYLEKVERDIQSKQKWTEEGRRQLGDDLFSRYLEARNSIPANVAKALRDSPLDSAKTRLEVWDVQRALEDELARVQKLDVNERAKRMEAMLEWKDNELLRILGPAGVEALRKTMPNALLLRRVGDTAPGR